MVTQISNYIDGERDSIQLSIDLITEAKNKQMLTTRFGHAICAVVNTLVIPLPIIAFVAETGLSIFKLSTLPLSAQPEKSKQLAFHLIDIVACPFGCLGLMVLHTIRVAGAVLGIALPKWAANIWLWTLKIQLFVVKKEAEFFQRCHSKVTGKPCYVKRVAPWAELYLGFSKSLALHQPKRPDEQVVISQIITRIKPLLEYVHQHHSLFNAVHKTLNFRQATQQPALNATTVDLVIQRIAVSSLGQIEDFYNYLNCEVAFGTSLFKSIGHSIKYLLDKQPIKRTTFNELGLEVRKLLWQGLEYGVSELQISDFWIPAV